MDISITRIYRSVDTQFPLNSFEGFHTENMPDQDVSPLNHRSAQIQRFDQNDQYVRLCQSCGGFRNFSYQYESCFGCGVNFYTKAKPGISSSAKAPPPSPYFSCSVLPATPARAHFVQTSSSSTVTNRSREAGATAQPSPPPTRAVRGRADLATQVDRATRLYRYESWTFSHVIWMRRRL